MDFSTIRQKVLEEKYGSWDELESDMMLMFDNAMLYNGPDTIFHQLALTMKNLASKLLDLGKQVRVAPLHSRSRGPFSPVPFSWRQEWSE